MTNGSEFTALLDLLEEIPAVADDVQRRGGATATESPTDRREAVLRRLRTDPEARLTLFRLALEVKRGSADSEAEFRSECRRFARAVEDRFDVDLLGTAAARRDELPAVPAGLLDGSDGPDSPDGADGTRSAPE